MPFYAIFPIYFLVADSLIMTCKDLGESIGVITCASVRGLILFVSFWDIARVHAFPLA